MLHSMTWGNFNRFYVDGLSHIENISLLMHFDGLNGSTTFTDDSIYAHDIAISSTATITTSQSVFGGSSGSINGYLYNSAYSEHLDLNSGDFSISMRVRPTSVSAGTFTMFAIRETGKNAQIYIRRSGSTLQFFCSTDGTSYAIQDTTCGTLALNSWNAICFERVGSNFNMYLDGVLTGTASSSSDLYTNFGSGLMYIMGEPANAFVGQIDELRILKGLSVHSSQASYSLETQEFSNYYV